MVRGQLGRIGIAALVALTLAGCAARGVRNQTRVAALGVVDAAVELSQVESNLFAGSLYGKPQHDVLVDAKLKVLYAARGFERAARALPASGTPASAAVETAREALLLAIGDLERVVPGVAAVKGPLDAALAVLREALPGSRLSAATRGTWPPLERSQLPMDATALLGLAQLIGGLIQSGRSSWARWRELAKAEGATDEELDEADRRISTEIDRVEAEKAGTGPVGD